MESGIVCLTFDDGREDNVDVFHNYLLANDIPVTLNVTTGYVDGSCPMEFQPSKRRAMTIQDVVSLSKSSIVEIAAHGDMHLNADEDIDRGHAKLCDWVNCGDSKPMGFASPSTQFSLSRLGKNQNWLKEHDFSYIAMGQRRGRWDRVQLLCRKVGRIFHLPVLYEIAYNDTLMDRCEDGVVFRVPVHKDTTVRQVKRLVSKCIKDKKALFFMFHSVDSTTDDTWVWDEKKFQSLCLYLIKKRAEGSLQLCTVKEALSLMEMKND